MYLFLLLCSILCTTFTLFSFLWWTFTLPLMFCYYSKDHSRASLLKHLSGCYNAVHLRVELRDLGLCTSTSSLDIIKILDIFKVVPIYLLEL